MNTLLEEAQFFLNNGNKKEAFKKFRQLLKENPNVPEAWYGISICIDDISKKEYALKRLSI